MLVMEKEELLKHLSMVKEENLLVIVEGHNDKKALENFGIRKIITLYGKPLFKVVESVDEPVVILTDLDKEGKQIYGKLNSMFSERGIHVNNELRHFLFKNTKLRQIEGLKSYLDKLK